MTIKLKKFMLVTWNLCVQIPKSSFTYVNCILTLVSDSGSELLPKWIHLNVFPSFDDSALIHNNSLLAHSTDFKYLTSILFWLWRMTCGTDGFGWLVSGWGRAAPWLWQWALLFCTKQSLCQGTIVIPTVLLSVPVQH